MRLILASLIAPALLIPLATPAGGQADEPQLKVVNVDSSAYPTIDAIVTVPMVLSGRSLGGDHFDVLEGNERRTVEVRPFDPSELTMVVVIDSTISPEAFINAQGGLLEMPVHLSEPTMAIVRAGNPTAVALAPTRDPAAASAAIRSLAPSAGESTVEDGIAVAFDQFTVDGSRRAIVVVTSDVELEAGRIARATDRAVREGVAVYVINMSAFVPSEMEELSNATGGTAWAVEPADVVPTIDQVVAELRGQYQLTAQLRGDDPSAPVTAVVSAGGITARSRLPFAIPVAVALSSESAPAPASDASAGLPWPLLLAGALGVMVLIAVLIAGLIGVRSTVFHRSQEHLEAG